MKHSHYDSEGRLFVVCVECVRGYYGDKSCSAGWQHKKHKGNGCFTGELLDEHKEAEQKE
jgi:hypothetical protein